MNNDNNTNGLNTTQNYGADKLEYWFIRHGESEYNRTKIIQGQSDSELSELGKKQSQKLANRLTNEHFDHVYSSDLIRARHTAEIALPNANIITDTRIREIHFGSLEGKKWNELDTEDAKTIALRHKEMEHFRLPEGESNADVRTRLKEFLREIPQTGKIAIFCHGGVISNMLVSVLNINMPNYYDLRFRIENTSITRINIEHEKDLCRILCINDTAHLMFEK